MRLALAFSGTAIAALMLSAAPLNAQLGRGAEAINVGRGVICDTSDQAQRFLTLRNGGTETTQALLTINKDAASETACGEAIVAFRVGEPLKSGVVEGLGVNVVKITVVAYSDGQKWMPIPETAQYAIVAPRGIDV
jgi:hypothetical protein